MRFVRSITTLRRLSGSRPHLSRPFGSAAAVLAPSESSSVAEASVFEYLEGFPRPDPKHSETILAVPRAGPKKIVAAKERKAGRVPSILFEQEKGEEGGNKRLISVRTNQIRKLVNHLGYSFFLSRLFDLEVRPDFGSDEVIEKVRVLPRKIWNHFQSFLPTFHGHNSVHSLKQDCLSLLKLHLEAGTEALLNVTFLRAPSHALLKVDVPLVFRGDDVSPGLRKGACLNTIKRTVKCLCPADIVPPYIDVDLSELDIDQKIIIGDLKVHPALQILRSKDEPVCKIGGIRGA
ncbi:hypothetical protein QJS10_CPA03g00277 [Acorus calamus]|uniref:Ribosomal protein L25 beta domain-containing protein n=1 Tax=Acorus calamus TaxID=4465 RepID=A0AAV9FC37_ACOCL|nr:hypothetical protein QJS10_CPA03g00277 [Acorus calamus]